MTKHRKKLPKRACQSPSGHSKSNWTRFQATSRVDPGLSKGAEQTRQSSEASLTLLFCASVNAEKNVKPKPAVLME